MEVRLSRYVDSGKGVSWIDGRWCGYEVKWRVKRMKVDSDIWQGMVERDQGRPVNGTPVLSRIE